MTDSFLCNIWRLIAMDLELSQSLLAIREQVARRLPLDGVVVRQVLRDRGVVQTIAAVPAAARLTHAAEKIEIGAPHLAWASGGMLRDDPEEVPEGLLPGGLAGRLLAGPLLFKGELVGVVVWQLHRDQPCRHDALALLDALGEPLGVAVHNHQQIHELRGLQEKYAADNRSLLSRLDRQDISASIIGASTGLKDVVERIDLVGASEVPVLLLGETGSGKEVVARAVHQRSRRSAGPFLRVNCGAIPPELIDSQLFGHERGSFTGAESLHKGWFERADGGTLFLDEIGDLPLPAQVRLLRILQDGSFERVGGQRQLRVDVRIIAATHRDLKAMVAQKLFREDLWYRIAVFPIVIPPLRERREDIAPLALHFALSAAKRLGALPLSPDSAEMSLLMNYSWPGNVRELAAVMERAAILGNGRRLEIAKALGWGLTGIDAPADEDGSAVVSHAQGTLDEVVAGHIRSMLQSCHGRVEGRFGAAVRLGINPNTLRAKMRRLGIDWRRYRGDG
jgi:transcriptional regulator with GAF, ATPase, and Fis domain